MKNYYVVIGLLFSIATYGQQTIVFQETFETGSVFTASEDCHDDPPTYGYDYFTRTTSGSGADGDHGYRVRNKNVYLSPEGSWFWAAQDTDGAPCTMDVQTLEKTGIDISGKTTNLSLVLLAAEDDEDDPTQQKWDNDTHVFVEVKIDGGSYVKVLQFSAGADGTSDNDMEPKLDTNLDGTGDGTAITDTFQEFRIELSGFSGLTIPSSASTLDLKITFDALEGSGEDFAIDNIRIVQNYATPAPAAPEITSNGGGDTASVSVAENTTAVTTVTATDANDDVITYSIDSSSPDASQFTITARTDGTGADLAFTTAPDYETPASAVGTNEYMVVVKANDGTLSDTQTITVTVTDVDETAAPEITSNGGGVTASVSVAENTTAVTTVTATGANGGPIIYSIETGVQSPDASQFTITARTDGTGADLAFTTAPDYEAPASTAGTNEYMVVVNANDGTLSDTQTITVTITDVDEAVTSVDENTITYSVTEIYPNPSSDFVFLPNVTKTEKYRIYTLSGIEVLQGTISATKKIDIKKLTNGLYFLKVNNRKAIKFLKK